MINFLSSWVKNLALALIIVSILEMILPNNKTKKYVKMVMGLYILFSIISPFIENSNKFNFNNIDLNSYVEEVHTTSSTSEKIDQTSMDDRLSQIYKEELENNITQKVEEKGYIVENCKVVANISQNDSNIEKITLKIGGKKVQNSDNQENTTLSEIQKVEKIDISVYKNKENAEEQESEETLKITKNDVKIIKDLLINEYGVNEKCLKIS